MIKNIAIAGAGISGMSTAFVLKEKGYRVTIYARAFSPNITSNKAAAFWFPYHIRNDKRGIGWCNTSYRYYLDFANDPTTGIGLQKLIKVLRTGVPEEEPIWREFMPGGSYSVIPGSSLAPGIEKAYDIQVPLIETQIFLPWLQQQLEQRGVVFIEQELQEFDALCGEYDLVINCTGLGSKILCKDESMLPIKGQVALLEPGTDLPIYLDNEKPLYIVPRKDAIIIGGTFEEGLDTEATEPETIERLLRNAYEVFPELKGKQVIGSWAGVRPYRSDVRVEQEPGRNLIHNYGHGGSGFTLAFGCAESVGAIVASAPSPEGGT
ncbi:MAG: FAD-dependent oxidoreductase [Ferruginibacter sp.]